MKKFLLFLFVLFISLSTIGCNKEKKQPKLNFEKVYFDVVIGDEFKLNAQLTNTESEINYDISGNAIQFVAGSTFKAVAKGEATITASLKDNPDVSVLVTVKVTEPIHVHSYTLEVVKDEFLVSAATEDAPAKYYKSCSCGEHGTETFEYGEKLPHTHKYTLEVVKPEFLASEATEEVPAKYYKSCACGEHGTETFEYGEKLPHTHKYTLEVVKPEFLASEATEEAPAKYYKSCACGEHGSEVFSYGEKLPHTHKYTLEVVKPEFLASEATEEAPAKYYKSCACGEHGTETFEYGEKLPSLEKEVTYELNGGSWSWEASIVSVPKSGIDNDSNLPEVLMGDIFYYLLSNDLLKSSKVYSAVTEKAKNWDSFKVLWSDPYAIYNNNSSGGYSTNDGYAQFFWDSITTDAVATGGFFGTSPYKEKYANLLSMVYKMTHIRYTSITDDNLEQGFAFVLDGYLYGTQGLMSSGTDYELFNFYRSVIPTPGIGYEGQTKVEKTYQIAKFTDSATLVAPVKEGYAFVGWYLNSDLSGDAVTSVDKKTTVYAKWYDLNYKPPVYTIEYNLNEGVNASNAPLSFVEGEEVILPTPTKSGFRFLGWTMEGVTGYVEKITEAQKANVVLTAVWEEKGDTITISYAYEDGQLLTHTATSYEEFLETFWNEYYAWSKASVTLDSFKASQIAAWKSSTPGTYPLYKVSGATEIDNAYFVNTKGNDLWLAWMNSFESVVKSINGAQTAWGSAFVGYKRVYEFFTKSTASYWNAERFETIYTAYPIKTPLIEEFKIGEEISLIPLTINDGRIFMGWYDANDNLISNTNQIEDNITLTAKWSASTPIVSFEVTNKIDKIERLNEYQLTWAFNPIDATNKKVSFTSSDPSVLAIDEEGKMNALKDGKATITVIVAEDSKFNVSFEVEVYINPFIDIDFENVAYVKVGEKINVIPTIYGTNSGKVLYTALNESVATILPNGEITGVTSGYVEFKAYLEGNEDVATVFGVTVLTESEYEMYQVVVDAHNADVHVTRDLNVAYAYLTDVYTSVSKLLYNHEYTINRDYEAKQASLSTNHGGTKTSNEFICVHYTAGSNSSSTGAANASYFANGGSESSIHYTTGNDGIFHVLDDSLVGWHAGDGTGTAFKWTNTNVVATENVKPVWGVIKNSNSSSGYYFTLNGQATTIVVPTTGTKSNGASATMEDPSKCFTYFGPAWKVVDGYYYMGNTWACFTQTLAGAISSRGGNNNSIGIETACNKGSDLWLTYQYTAELVARLMDANNLDITRVVGHNAFSGKDCPQTLLANGGELWEIFIQNVQAEYDLYTKMTKENKYTLSSKSNNPDILSDDGRIISIPNYTTSVSYTVTITDTTTNVAKEITFSSIVHGTYTE